VAQSYILLPTNVYNPSKIGISMAVKPKFPEVITKSLITILRLTPSRSNDFVE